MIPAIETGHFSTPTPKIYKYRKVFNAFKDASDFFDSWPRRDIIQVGYVVYWNDPVEQEPEVSQEEIWLSAIEGIPKTSDIIKYLTEHYTITRKTTPQ